MNTTDSGTNIPRPTGLRRIETPGRPGLIGLLTNHIVAKIVALLFACVVIVLIDRELEETLSEAEYDVLVGPVQNEAALLASGRHLLILETAPGVSVVRFQPAQVKVTIKGPEKLADQVRARAPRASVQVKTDWLKEAGGTLHAISRPIVAADLSVGVRGVTVTMDSTIQVDLDPEVTREIPLRAAARGVPAGHVPEITFEPPRVRVQGPESWFAGVEQITVDVPVAGRSHEFTWEMPGLPEEVLNKHVRLAGDERVVAHVGFSRHEPMTFEVKDIPIRQLNNWDETGEYEFGILGLPTKFVTVTLEGTPEAVQYWREAANVKQLTAKICAFIDTDILARRANPQPGATTSDYAEVGVMGIPDDPHPLRLASVTPTQVDVQVTRKSP